MKTGEETNVKILHELTEDEINKIESHLNIWKNDNDENKINKIVYTTYFWLGLGKELKKEPFSLALNYFRYKNL